ncbi:hypothetical protein ACJIZ3_019921 [Penstemon smallii]|uniref:Uncharacterized protein n=1 Tax=Penstemon smallii TaxID=265156 RepID=A0ABD3T2J1_9LAMI
MDLQYIQDIRPALRNWKVKVIVCDKTQARVSPSSSNPYNQRIILMDETESKYNIYNYPFQWTLKYFTKIRLQRNVSIHPSILNYRFASLRGLHSYIGKQILIDILAVVVEKKGEHHVQIRGEHMLKKEYLIMNEEKTTVLLTLWNNIAMSEGLLIDNSNEMLPIIRATALAISPFQGGSLGSTASTIIALNPQIPEATNLRRMNLLNLLNGTLKHQMFQLNTNTRTRSCAHRKDHRGRTGLQEGRMESQYMLKDIKFLGNIDYTTVLPLRNELYKQGWMTRKGINQEEEKQKENVLMREGTTNLPDFTF